MLVWGMDEVSLSAWNVGATRGSGIVSSAADVLWMSVVRGMRGVGEVCDMCTYTYTVFDSGRQDERIGFGLINPVRRGGVLDVCLCCGGVGG